MNNTESLWAAVNAAIAAENEAAWRVANSLSADNHIDLPAHLEAFRTARAAREAAYQAIKAAEGRVPGPRRPDGHE